MDKSLKIYIVLLVLIIIGVVIADSNEAKPIDWTPTYAVSDKIPFGLYVFDKETKDFFKNQKIEKLSLTPYEYLESKYDDETLVKNYKIKGTIINISEFSKIDAASVKELCYFVSHGNTAFLSGKVLPNELLDTLKLKMDSEYKMSDSITNWVANPKLGTSKYRLTEGGGNNYFSKTDPKHTTILGFEGGDSTRVNFIKVNYHHGAFLLHTQPAAFTNFHLLKGNHHEYAEKVLSYIPNGNIYWFIKNQDGNVISQSPMRYILSQPALKWAWFIFLFGMVVFMFFNARRKQRIVPIIAPMTNTTTDFAKSIGNLYYQEGDHDNIINKKIIYFLEKVRNEYLIDTNKLDDDFTIKLHHKSGKNINDIKRAVFLINAHAKSPHSSIEEDLIQISNAIEKIM